MKTKAGIWIDHQEAVIVELGEAGQRMQLVQSRMENQRRRVGSQTQVASGEVPPDDVLEREDQEHLARYYDEIIPHLRAADEILIFGPGEAKGELKKRLAKEKASPRIFTLETSDKMTGPQIAAHVRKYFHHEAPRGRVTAGIRSQTIKAHYA